MRSRATSVALVIALVLVAPGSVGRASPALHRVPPLVPVAGVDALTRALAAGRISEASYALERARSLFDLEGVRARFGDVQRPDPRSATLVLRDLSLRVGRLAPADRAAARGLLARPTGPAGFFGEVQYKVPEEDPVCDANLCVHYVASTKHKPDMTDADLDGVPDFVEVVLGVLAQVWDVEVEQMGYRPPRKDANSANDGGNGLLDVYLADVGDDGLFGYCSTDDPNLESRRYVSAYCVLDNDYDPEQFPPYEDPMDPLTVTAAHEFFHAVQFGYDIGEDGWLLESTATWIEDELYDDVNDNRFYLPYGPLGRPLSPLDRSAGFQVYGTWIFWRFLAEFLGAGASSDPTIVRAVWRRADQTPGAPRQYSTQALASAVAARTVNGAPWKLRRAFRTFSAWNARPREYYEEGIAYPAAKISKRAILTGASPTNTTTAELDHLSSRFVAFRRGTGLKAGARLRVAVDGPARSTGSEASVSVVRTSGAVGSRVVKLDASGNGSVIVDFDASVARVVVIMTNGSSRYFTGTCESYLTPYACAGAVPVDEDRTYTFRVRVV